jgi:hypothetical protein
MLDLESSRRRLEIGIELKIQIYSLYLRLQDAAINASIRAVLVELHVS